MLRPLILILLFSLKLPARENDDSLRRADLKQKLREDSTRIFGYTPVIPYLKAEKRNSFFSYLPVSLYGMMAGGTLREHHVLSTGFYFLDPQMLNDILIVNDEIGKIRSLAHLNFCYQYILVSQRYFQLNLAGESGIGYYDIPRIASVPDHGSVDHGTFFPFGGGVQTTFKPFKWSGVSSLIGYRYVNENYKLIDFTGWYFSIALWLDLRDYTNKLRYKAKKRKYLRQIGQLDQT
jgi:hypothetical protein